MCASVSESEREMKKDTVSCETQEIGRIPGKNT